MPQSRVQFAQIESWQPAADYRKTGAVGVITGRNFAWDADGVGAAFATRLVSAGNVLSTLGEVAQEITVDGGYHVVVGDKVTRLTNISSDRARGDWETVATLDRLQFAQLNLVPQHYTGFTSAFMDGFTYICGWNYGVYRYDSNTVTYTRLRDINVPGFPADSEPVIAIAETNGRMLYLTDQFIYWSGPAAPESLQPTLGGAGFQSIAQHIAGAPRAMVATSTGAVIWTTRGALAAEFIGGEAVFRFFELPAEVFPLSQVGIASLPDTSFALLTRLGVYVMNSGNTQNAVPQALTPLFNEFLREYMRSRPIEVGYLWYTHTDNRLFVSFKSDGGTFLETFALDIALDRWGSLNDLHLGLFHYGDTNSPFGYMNTQGVVSYFLSSRVQQKGKENPAAPGTFTGLNSEIVLGYIRSENMAQHGDDVQELQEVIVYRKGDRVGIEDVTSDEGFVLSVGAIVVDEGLVTDPVTSVIDEGLVGQSNLVFNYKLEVLSDLFSGNTTLPVEIAENTMYLAFKGVFADTWTSNLPSFYFRLRFSANEPDDYYRINAVDCTLSTAGQLL